ncbi:hypothetical protein [uncultured Campylobacter sp.]|uniref:hypothetical protein n=1 Tax=uncultured Campylobacter sp. TaxID=218934 RepID=UPI00263165BC|nr:hypothetical protein [uncultured Campylobacter sp.]
MKFQGAIKFSLRFDIIVQNLSEGNMKNFIFLWLLLVGCAFGAAKEDAAASTTQQVASNLPQPNFEIFYDENASDAQIDAGLDALLEFAAQNRGRIDEDFGEFKDRIFTAFIFNPKVLRNSKFDFERIEKILKFKPNLNYGGDGGYFSPLKLAIFFGSKFSSEIAKLYHFDKADAMRLLELLVRNGADVKASGLLRDAAANDNFEAFKFLIANGARDTKDVVGSVAGSELIFLSDNNVSILGYKEALPLAAREFAAGTKFKEFRDGRLCYLDEILKFQSFASIDKKEIETLIKVAVVLDDEMTAEFLLSRGLCKQKGLCEFLKVQAKTYDAAKISKILSRKEK